MDSIVEEINEGSGGRAWEEMSDQDVSQGIGCENQWIIGGEDRVDLGMSGELTIKPIMMNLEE